MIMKVEKNIINKIDQIFPDPFFAHQISSWRESKQNNFFKTLKSYLAKELSPSNIVNSFHEMKDMFRNTTKEKKGFALFKAIFLP